MECATITSLRYRLFSLHLISRRAFTCFLVLMLFWLKRRCLKRKSAHHNTTQHSTVQHNTTQHNTTRQKICTYTWYFFFVSVDGAMECCCTRYSQSVAFFHFSWLYIQGKLWKVQWLQQRRIPTILINKTQTCRFSKNQRLNSEFEKWEAINPILPGGGGLLMPAPTLNSSQFQTLKCFYIIEPFLKFI